MDSSFGKLSERSLRILEKSWGHDFAVYVFPAIDSNAFKVLYSGNGASRPAVPANYIIGALIIKELFGFTDDETVEMVCFDVRARFALHSVDLPDYPISDRTFSRKCNAVDEIMFVMERRYHADDIPVFTKVHRSKIFFYFKIETFNVVKILKFYLRIRGKNKLEVATAKKPPG
jgi:hypothetical protein